MDTLRAVTLNIWNRQGPWDRRLPLLRDGLAALDADVIGLQEVMALGGQSQADELAAGFGWHVHYAPAWSIGGGLSWGNAIVSKWPLARTAVLPLPAPADLDTRSAAFAVLDAPCGQVPVFCTHLTFQLHRSDARCEQVRVLADHVAEQAPVDGFPPILLGDFNADPDSDEMRFLRGLTPLGGRSVYFADAWSTTETGPGWTYDRRNPYALRSREPSRRIDYVLSRGPDRAFRGEPVRARLVLDKEVAGVWPSDHFGVLAEIQAAARPHAPF